MCLLCGGRYAFCIHTGGLSCVTLLGVLQRILKLHFFTCGVNVFEIRPEISMWSLTCPAFGVIMNSLLFLPLRLKSPCQIVLFPISYDEDHEHLLAPRSNHKANTNCQQCLVANPCLWASLELPCTHAKLRNIKKNRLSSYCCVTDVYHSDKLFCLHGIDFNAPAKRWTFGSTVNPDS